MAWEDFEQGGVAGMTGDKSVDELALALDRIARAYRERYSRKPSSAEVLYALQVVVNSHPARYTSDDTTLDFGALMHARRATRDEIGRDGR